MGLKWKIIVQESKGRWIWVEMQEDHVISLYLLASRFGSITGQISLGVFSFVILFFMLFFNLSFLLVCISNSSKLVCPYGLVGCLCLSALW